VWKSIRILLLSVILAGLLYFVSPANALDMTAMSVNITVTVSPLVAPTITNDGGASLVAANSARLNGEVTSTGNENPLVTIFIGTTDGGNTPALWDDNVSLGAKALGTFYYDATGLAPTTTYYYTMRAVNTGGTAWALTSENFTTPAAFAIPGSLVLTDFGAITIGANWTRGAGTVYTMLRVSRTIYPTTPTEGELFVYTDLESANSTGYSLDTNAYYVSAWGFAADNVTYTPTYATATIGGGAMTAIATAITGAITTLTGYIPAFISLFLMFGLTILGFWHRDKIILILAGLIFIAYGFDYWPISHFFSIFIVVSGIAIFAKGFIQKKAKE
jgi:hypothetical protein